MQELVADQEFTIQEVTKVGDLDRLLRISAIFALRLIGRKLMKEEVDLVGAILNYYKVQEKLQDF